MVLLLARRLAKSISNLRIARPQRLSLVERLRADLACVVYAHQGGGVRPRGWTRRRLHIVRGPGRRRP